uniref:BapA/Bap/LapF family prefix-like domain-containing protein n=1 Tax=Acinetobacter higginsii TaxID=70347 RepID=UPI0030092DD2
MTNFVVIKKDSLNKVTVNAERITLSEASIVHTKMHRQDVAEFFRDGNNLVLKLVNGEIVVVENFFITYDNVASDLVFEEDGCVLYWFDGVSGFKGIPGLETLLPAASAAQLGGILPWLAGAAVVGGIAAIIADHDKDKKIPDGTVALKIGTDGKIIGTTKEIPAGTDVMVTVKGKDKDGNEVTKQIPTKVQPDGSFQVDVPAEIVDGSKIDATATSKDRNGQDRTGTDELAGSNETGSNGGLNREPSEIKVTIGTDGKLTGTTKDVAPGSKVIITVEGLDKDGNPVKTDVETTVKSDGSYETQVPSEIVDGSPIDATAKTTDRNGKQITGTDELAGSDEPDSNGGLDRTPGAIDLVVTPDGKLTGTTKDVKPGQEVTITVKGVDKNGNPVEEAIKTTVNPDGSYIAELPPTTKLADGSPLDAEAKTKDRNGNEISGKDDLGGTGTPDAGLNLVPGS